MFLEVGDLVDRILKIDASFAQDRLAFAADGSMDRLNVMVLATKTWPMDGD